MTRSRGLVVKDLGLRPYTDVWQQMQDFTAMRSDVTADELWLVRHPPTYTLGQTGRREHLLSPGDIPVVQTDRGGEVTYHGPGQLVCYLLFDLRRLNISARGLVTGMERSVIRLLADHGVVGSARADAPGVYVSGRKVAALGLRIRKARSYHGLSLNVDMDLAPYANINPCGYKGLEVTDTKRLGIDARLPLLARQLTALLCAEFGYDAITDR